ncbi:hypothetical protein PybrP1_006556, partial [[Pythium] brassicae (nom. inval.)]
MPPDPTNQEQKGPKDAADTPVTETPEYIRALKKVKTLVGSMYEARDMTAHVAYGNFLNRFSGKKTVFRLVCNREVVSQIQDFHKDIDKALSGLGLNVDETAERAANGNLADYLFSEKNRRKTWKLLHDAANGLRALHHRRILHNDLKCNNILAVANARLESLSRFVQFVVQDAELPVEVDYGANETAHTIGVFEGGAGGAKV